MSQSSTGPGGTGQQPADPNATVLLPGGQPFQQQAPQQEQQPPQQDYGQHQPPQDYGQHQSAPQQPQQFPAQQDYGQQYAAPQQGYDQQQYGQQQYGQQQHGAAAYGGQPAARTPVGGAAKAIAGLLLLTAVVVGIGSVTRWVEAGILSQDGLDADGVITLPLAIIAAVFALVRLVGKLPTTAAIVGLVAGLLLTLIGFIDVADVRDSELGVEVGYGLWMVLAGGIAMVLVSIAGIVKRR